MPHRHLLDKIKLNDSIDERAALVEIAVLKTFLFATAVFGNSMQTKSSPCYGVRLLLLMLGLLVAASMPIGVAAGAPAPAATAIDWSRGEAQITNANCGALSFTNMKDHHEYTLWLKGTISGTCTFKADGLTFHLPPNFGPTDSGTTTLFSFQRFGPDVLVAWIPGY